MKNYEFGMKAESMVAATLNDFVVYKSDDGGNYNPYNKAYFNDPKHLSVCKDPGRITSIPSPYARMHVTDLAFQEYNCGFGVVSATKKAKLTMSADYNRAMSHCLDVFELLFHADEFDLKEKGITLHKIDLVSIHSQNPDIHNVLYDEDEVLTNVGRYIATLDLFRDEYNKVIQKKGVSAYKFDFSSLYILKYKGKTFASTSPFTGFCAKSDCDLETANIEINKRKILSKDETTWCGVDSRDLKFRKFLYLLLRDTGLKDVFANLYLALSNSLDSELKTKLDDVRFAEQDEYKKFNVGNVLLQKVKGQKIYIRPDGLDCSYLKYLLYLAKPVDLTIKERDYDIENIEERRFPSENGAITPWVGANDILADALFVLTYDINDNYVVVPFVDKVVDERDKRRCLLPIKRKALEFFSIEELVNNMKIEHREKNVYSVSLKIYLENGGNITLRRDYLNGNQFPNGAVVCGENMKPFAFGIYPFIKSKVNKNIYKVLFYNSFEDDYSIRFYKRDDNNKVQEFLDTERKKNRTNDIVTNQNDLPVNCEYHHLETTEGLEFAELTVGTGKKKYTSLIVPKMRDEKDVHTLPGTVNVAIDLGTSNTYIAYTYQSVGDEGLVPEIEEICTNHGLWNELTFMNKRCEKEDYSNAPEKNRDDLYLKTSDQDDKPSDEWLDSQLCEFIPSRIEPSKDQECYSFPIPTVINFLRKNSQREAIDYQKDCIPLLHCAIPFAYYERGIRLHQQKTYFDLIKDGNQFKWFYTKNENGDFKPDEIAKACFKAFVNELLFIVRSHLVCCGYNLNETRILWSYPLSFSPELVREYDKTWKEAYKNIINPNIRNQDIPQFVKYTNESRSPIFECLTNPSHVDKLTLLVDIGGGSTDIIGYQNKKPLFISSFGFAGNSLYLDGQLERVSEADMKGSLLYYYVAQQEIFKQDTNNKRTKKISKDDPISTIMNYGFTKDPGNFRNIFDNAGPKFMLLFHNAAIIYHMAQLCKIQSPDEIPVQVFLTGNGSKLFELNKSYKSMVKDIFHYVYHKNDSSHKLYEDINDMSITKPDNPKAATVRGALKGFVKQELATNEESSAKRIVMLGDSKTVYPVREDEGGAVVDYDGDYKVAVFNNVKDFIEMFYQKVYTISAPKITKKEMLKAVDFVRCGVEKKFGNNTLLSDSLFFQYIAKLMPKISFELREKLG